MRQTLIVAAALFLGCATGAAVRDIVVPVRAQGVTGALYEYRVVKVNPFAGEDAQVLISRFAKEGWRYVGLAGMSEAGFSAFWAFERPRASAPGSAPQGQQ